MRHRHHRHSGIGCRTPTSVHFGTAAEVRLERAVVFDAAYAAHPDRFVNGAPTPPRGDTGEPVEPVAVLAWGWVGV